MPIRLKRAYLPPSADDGYRVLVDRIWPRGISKEEAKLDEWLKDVAPSTELRKWIHEDRSRWEAFRERYVEELERLPDTLKEALKDLARRARRETVTLVYSARDEVQNNAVVLKEYLESLDVG